VIHPVLAAVDWANIRDAPPGLPPDTAHGDQPTAPGGDPKSPGSD